MTATEWRTEGGGFKEASKTDYKRLPFYCCAISFLPFEDAVRSCHVCPRWPLQRVAGRSCEHVCRWQTRPHISALCTSFAAHGQCC